jgi:hypothetical protein
LLLLAFNGAVLAGLASVADKDLPLPAQLFGGAAVLTLAASAVLLLLVVRPNLGGGAVSCARAFLAGRAQLSEEDLLNAMRQNTRAVRVQLLSLIAVAKFERLARAVDIILAALALLLITAVLAVVGSSAACCTCTATPMGHGSGGSSPPGPGMTPPNTASSSTTLNAASSTTLSTGAAS